MLSTIDLCPQCNILHSGLLANCCPSDLCTFLTCAQVKEEADLEVDFLFVDVEGVLPQLYQVVEVVFMGNSIDRSSETGEEVG